MRLVELGQCLGSCSDCDGTRREVGMVLEPRISCRKESLVEKDFWSQSSFLLLPPSLTDFERDKFDAFDRMEGKKKRLELTGAESRDWAFAISAGQGFPQQWVSAFHRCFRSPRLSLVGMGDPYENDRG